jgi:pyruvate/2-oxoglutarate dehydrogenase complex dihydrolipoamide dehydrogenase (E3) component
MDGIVRWLDGQVRKLGADVRVGTAATRELIEAENPDVVIIATGGTPAPFRIPGAELVTDAWKILSGEVQPGENILVYDEVGMHQGLTVADFCSTRGSLVELVTPDQVIGEDVGNSARKSFLKRLYARNVVMTQSHHLVRVYTEGNSLIAVLREHYSNSEFEREVTQVISELGTVPVEDLYFELKPRSTNHGELDMAAFLRSELQTINRNPDGTFKLFRIGDAVLSRNVHAAIFDGTRIARGI